MSNRRASFHDNHADRPGMRYYPQPVPGLGSVVNKEEGSSILHSFWNEWEEEEGGEVGEMASVNTLWVSPPTLMIREVISLRFQELRHPDCGGI